MKLHSLVIAVSLGLLLNGCSITSQVFGSKTSRPIPLKPLKVFTTSINTKKAWEVKTGSAMGDNKIHPFIDAQFVYIAGSQSASAWQKSTGKAQWKVDIGESISAGVNGNGTSNVNNSQVFIGTNNGNAISLDAKTGKVQWIERLSSEVQSISPSKDGRVAFRTIDGKLHGLSSSTGELIWQQSQTSPALTLHGASVPILVGPLVVAGFDNGKVAAYQLQDGLKAWEIILAEARGTTELDRIIDVDGKLMSLGNALFGASLHGNIRGINLAKGATTWSNSFSTSTGVNVNTQGLYTSDDKGNIWRINPQTGAPAWKMDDLERYEPTLPALAGDSLLVIGDKKGNIHWVNAKTGLFVARNQGDPAGYSIEPEISGGSVYAIGKSGILSRITW
ncbi:MAG: outer membrane protein assembly factor BamB [Thiotrichaceae bacterium]|nr:outer membrane protein assembly factor BamB [Thiotrichaceae bacterium]